jgi:hypothetical protein
MAKTLTKSQVGIFAEKIMDWGNLIFVGLVVGQLIPGTKNVDTLLFIVGFTGIIFAYATAYMVMKRR